MNIQVCIGCAFESHEYSGFKTLSAYGSVERRFYLYYFFFVHPRNLAAPWSKIVASFEADDPLS